MMSERSNIEGPVASVEALKDALTELRLATLAFIYPSGLRLSGSAILLDHDPKPRFDAAVKRAEELAR